MNTKKNYNIRGCDQITTRVALRVLCVPENEMGNEFVGTVEAGKAREEGKRNFLSKFAAATRRDIASGEEQQRQLL